jgi:hypothetical protein
VRVAVARRVFAHQQRFEAVVGVIIRPQSNSAMLHVAALAGLLALVERRQHGLRRVHAGEQVHRGHAELQRRLVGLAVQRHQARFALHHEVVARARGLGAGAVVARDRAVDEARVLLAQLLVAQAQLVDAAELEVLDHHVALLRKVARDLLAFGRLQVERDRALVAVDAVEVGGLGLAHAQAPVARVVAAARVLDLDHLGAHVGQHHAAPGARQDAGQVEDAHAGKRQR